MTHTHSTSPALRAIAEKVNNQIRITDQDCQLLFEEASLGFVGTLANQIRESKNGNRVYFNRNFHIEPTNVCVFSCQFCAYSRLYANREEGWELSIEQMLHLVKKYDGIPVTEVHIVGGVHPKMNLTFFKELLAAIKDQLGIPSNATMLYGHIESYKHRIDHMHRLRALQDRTGGFNTFIPLKFRNKDNDMSHVTESTLIEDMRMYAIARIYLDNFSHLKAYWPMLGRQNAQLSLSFGVDDIDGTIDDSTKIYSMAGSEEQSPTLTTNELVDLIRQAGRDPIERDTIYNVVNDFSIQVN